MRSGEFRRPGALPGSASFTALYQIDPDLSITKFYFRND